MPYKIKIKQYYISSQFDSGFAISRASIFCPPKFEIVLICLLHLYILRLGFRRDYNLMSSVKKIF